MYKGGKRKYLLFIFIALINYQQTTHPAEGKGQVCEIKYNKQNLEKTNTNFPFALLKTRCWKIGIEFDEFGDAIPDKPIFACCKPEE